MLKETDLIAEMLKHTRRCFVRTKKQINDVFEGVDIAFFGIHHVNYLLQLARVHFFNIVCLQQSLYNSVCCGDDIYERDVAFAQYAKRRTSLERLIMQLEGKRQYALCKPMMPRMRNAQWFVKGDAVYVQRSHENNTWNTGQIVHINAATDGTRRIIVCCGGLVKRVFTWNDPCIIKEWEHQYFQRDPLFFALWMEYGHVRITHKAL